MKREDWGNVAYGGDVNPPCNQEGGSGNPPDLIEKHACHGALPFSRDRPNNRQNIGYCQQANLPVYFPISQYQANSPKNQWLGFKWFIQKGHTRDDTFPAAKGDP